MEVARARSDGNDEHAPVPCGQLLPMAIQGLASSVERPGLRLRVTMLCFRVMGYGFGSRSRVRIQSSGFGFRLSVQGSWFGVQC